MNKKEAEKVVKKYQYLAKNIFKKNGITPQQNYLVLLVSSVEDINNEKEYIVIVTLQHIIDNGATIPEELNYFLKNYTRC